MDFYGNLKIEIMKEKIIKVLEKDNIEIDFISHIGYKCTSTYNDGISDSGSAFDIIRIGDRSITRFNTKNPEINISSDLMDKIKQSIIETIKNHN